MDNTNEWNVKNAYVKNSKGVKIIDLKNNLHLVNYSHPINKKINFEQLNKHLFKIQAMPNAIPYVTSYYNKTWGFCLSYNQYKKINKKINLG